MATLAVAFLLALTSEAALAEDICRNGRESTYTVGGQNVQLMGGRAETPAAPGSAAHITTQVVEGPVYGDLDGDGRDDVALFLVQTTGGSGTFYYAAAVADGHGACLGTNAVFLGDRVVPRQLRIEDGILVVLYADRAPGEPMSALPTVDKTLHLVLKNGRLETVDSPR